MSNQRFKVGQSVNYTSGPRGAGRTEAIYKVTQVLPPVGDERQYRIKSASEPHERVAKETELRHVA